MKRVLAALIFICALGVGSQAMAQTPNESGFGIGIGTSNLASGLSMKAANGPTAYQIVVGGWRGYWFAGRRSYYEGLGASFDFLFEQPSITTTEPFNLGWNAGLGGGVGFAFDRYFGFGVNGVLGLEFNINPVPIDFTIEYRPGLFFVHDDFDDDTDIDIAFFDLGAHLRFWL